MENQNAAATTEKRKVSIAEVYTMMKSGKDRKTIRKELGLTSHDARTLFKHEKLKGVRVEAVSTIELVDDMPSEAKKATTSAETSETATAQAETPATPETPAAETPATENQGGGNGWQ